MVLVAAVVVSGRYEQRRRQRTLRPDAQIHGSLRT